MPLTRIELDIMGANGCQCPACLRDTDLVYLCCRQHPRGGTQTSYKRGTGYAVVSCRVCRDTVAVLKIAES